MRPFKGKKKAQTVWDAVYIDAPSEWGAGVPGGEARWRWPCVAPFLSGMSCLPARLPAALLWGVSGHCRCEQGAAL